MPLTNEQKVALKALIVGNPTFNAYPNTPDGSLDLAVLLNTGAASPAFWIWRTSVSRAQVYNEVGPGGTTWSWTTYKSQTATEQNTWVQMFMGDQADFTQANFRTGVAAIFSGSAPANAQRDHILGVGRRQATHTEKLFATGTGSAASPGVATVTSVTYADVYEARNLP